MGTMARGRIILYCAVLLLVVVDSALSWKIDLSINYNESEKVPEIELRAAQENENGVLQPEKVIKRIRLRPTTVGKKSPTNSAPTETLNSEVSTEDIPIAVTSDKDSGNSQPTATAAPQKLNISMGNGVVIEYHEKHPDTIEHQPLVVGINNQEAAQEAAMFGTLVGQLSRPWNQLLGGQIGDLLIALNQTAGVTGGGGGGKGGGGGGGGGSGGQGGASGQSGGQGGGQGGAGGGQSGGQGGAAGQSGGQGGGQQGGGGGQSGQQGGAGGQGGGGGGGGQGGAGGAGSTACLARGSLCTVFSAHQCCSGTTCNVFPMGILGPLAGPFGGPLGTLALGSCR